MSQAVLDAIRSKFGEAVLETHAHLGDDTARLKPEAWRAVCTFVRDEPSLAMDMLVDLCGVDYPERGSAGERIEIVLHLMSTTRRHRVRLKTRVGDEELHGAEVESVTNLWPGANWLEREVFDMFGVKFRGHPDLRRILMYPEFEGYPLLKDYPANKTQPLVEYRTEEEAGVPLGKQAPFRADEGMSFGRRVYESDDGRNGEGDVRTLSNPASTEAV